MITGVDQKMQWAYIFSSFKEQLQLLQELLNPALDFYFLIQSSNSAQKCWSDTIEKLLNYYKNNPVKN